LSAETHLVEARDKRKSFLKIGKYGFWVPKNFFPQLFYEHGKKTTAAVHLPKKNEDSSGNYGGLQTSTESSSARKPSLRFLA